MIQAVHDSPLEYWSPLYSDEPESGMHTLKRCGTDIATKQDTFTCKFIKKRCFKYKRSLSRPP